MADRYLVHGMTCQGCVRSVTAAIQRAVPGVRVTVDLGAKTVAVDGQASSDSVRQAVEAAGFEFLGAA
jgi:copper chaperone